MLFQLGIHCFTSYACFSSACLACSGTIQYEPPPEKKHNEMTCAPSEDSDQPGPPASCCCLFGFYVAFNNFSVICCDRELNAHFYSAASLK